jgi:hypothetical protein
MVRIFMRWRGAEYPFGGSARRELACCWTGGSSNFAIVRTHFHPDCIPQGGWLELSETWAKIVQDSGLNAMPGHLSGGLARA